MTANNRAKPATTLFQCRRLDCCHAGTRGDFILCEGVITCPMCGHEEVTRVTGKDPLFHAHPPYVDCNGRTLRDIYANR